MDCNENTLAEQQLFVNERAGAEVTYFALEGSKDRKIETRAARIRQPKPANSSIEIGISNANHVAATPRFMPPWVCARSCAAKIDATADSKAIRSSNVTPAENSHD
jgi:hypothetical protein